MAGYSWFLAKDRLCHALRCAPSISSAYRALEMVQSMAQGRFAAGVADGRMSALPLPVHATESLHSDLLEPLAELVARASDDSQILIVTHSTELAELISAWCEVKRIDLTNHEGKTMDRNNLSETGGRVWESGD